METLEKKRYSTTEFVGGKWQQEINVRDFIQKNYTPYDGDSSFLAGPTEATTKLWQECCDLFKKERENGGVLDMDTKVVSTITSHGAGYIDKDLEDMMVNVKDNVTKEEEKVNINDLSDYLDMKL